MVKKAESMSPIKRWVTGNAFTRVTTKSGEKVFSKSGRAFLQKADSTVSTGMSIQVLLKVAD